MACLHVGLWCAGLAHIGCRVGGFTVSFLERSVCSIGFEDQGSHGHSSHWPELTYPFRPHGPLPAGGGHRRRACRPGLRKRNPSPCSRKAMRGGPSCRKQALHPSPSSWTPPSSWESHTTLWALGSLSLCKREPVPRSLDCQRVKASSTLGHVLVFFISFQLM